MTKTVLTTLLTLLLSLQVVSAQSSAPESDGASQSNRKNLKYQLTLPILGTEYIKNPITISAGYFIRPYGILLLRYSTLNSSNKYGAYKMRAVTLGYRRFFGNSFNVTPTIYYKRNTADFNQEGNIFSIGSNNLIYEDIGTGMRIGNEWQWENFTMGCDWFGLNLTSLKINYEEKSLGPIETHAPMKGLTITLLSFYLGYSF